MFFSNWVFSTRTESKTKHNKNMKHRIKVRFSIFEKFQYWIGAFLHHAFFQFFHNSFKVVGRSNATKLDFDSVLTRLWTIKPKNFCCSTRPETNPKLCRAFRSQSFATNCFLKIANSYFWDWSKEKSESGVYCSQNKIRTSWWYSFLISGEVEEI